MPTPTMTPTRATVPTPRAIAAELISAYQRYLSPRKGFACAHRALHGGPSCSQFARRVVLRRGVLRTLPHLWRRSARCAAAARRLRGIRGMGGAVMMATLDYESRARRHANQSQSGGGPGPGGECGGCGHDDVAGCLLEGCLWGLFELICSGF